MQSLYRFALRPLHFPVFMLTHFTDTADCDMKFFGSFVHEVIVTSPAVYWVPVVHFYPREPRANEYLVFNFNITHFTTIFPFCRLPCHSVLLPICSITIATLRLILAIVRSIEITTSWSTVFHGSNTIIDSIYANHPFSFTSSVSEAISSTPLLLASTTIGAPSLLTVNFQGILILLNRPVPVRPRDSWPIPRKTQSPFPVKCTFR